MIIVLATQLRTGLYPCCIITRCTTSYHSNPKEDVTLFLQLQVTGGSGVAVPMRRATRTQCVCSGADVILSHPRRMPPLPEGVSSTRL